VSQSRSVLVSQRDHARLLDLLAKSDPDAVALLYDELDRATVIADEALPADVVAMGSIVTFEDVRSGERSKIELVYPRQSDPAAGRVSILAPVGAALIGLREGETIEWPVPKGAIRHLRVVEVARGGTETES
jgi:regulator of nucleoside diphosphate kinase